MVEPPSSTPGEVATTTPVVSRDRRCDISRRGDVAHAEAAGVNANDIHRVRCGGGGGGGSGGEFRVSDVRRAAVVRASSSRCAAGL
jgi:hypothetical protein